MQTNFIKTYSCLKCGYSLPADIDPTGEYFTQRMLFATPGPMGSQFVAGCPAGICPSCYYHPDAESRSMEELQLITDLSNPESVAQINTLDDEEIEEIHADAPSEQIEQLKQQRDGDLESIEAIKVSQEADPGAV